MKRPRITPAQVESIYKLHAEGLTRSRIAKQLGISISNVAYRIDKLKAQGAKVAKVATAPAPPQSQAPTIPVLPRPMVAFVGTPVEVTNAIRELFS